jgi:hypothetical protein
MKLDTWVNRKIEGEKPVVIILREWYYFVMTILALPIVNESDRAVFYKEFVALTLIIMRIIFKKNLLSSGQTLVIAFPYLLRSGVKAKLSPNSYTEVVSPFIYTMQ